MRAYQDSKGEEVYDCSGCEQTFPADDYTHSKVVYVTRFVGGHNGDDDDAHCSYIYVEANITTNELGGVEDAWFCSNGCFHHDEGAAPETYRDDEVVWICGVCEARFSDDDYGDPEAAAVACCKAS